MHQLTAPGPGAPVIEKTLEFGASLAGLGCIGKNNLLVTPGFGPRVRLRAMFIHEAFPPTGPIDFDPCSACLMPCRKACPQGAFESEGFFVKESQTVGPARDSSCSRDDCSIQMKLDTAADENAETGSPGASAGPVRFCRRCEFACPVGKT